MKDSAKNKRKRGEEGFYERSVEAAHAATAAFNSVDEFNDAANKYFDECDENGLLYGEAGLCLGLTKYHPRGKNVTPQTLHKYFNGDAPTPELTEAVRMAYLRIQSQVETDERWREKGGMATRAIFLQKQKWFGGYQDKVEEKQEKTVTIIHGGSVEDSDFK